jgi:serine protease Do
MKRFLSVLFICASLLVPGCTTIPTAKNLYADYSDAVFFLQTADGGHCSSFHIGEGIIVTAAHCIESNGIGVVIRPTPDLEIENPQVLLDDDISDIAILSVPEVSSYASLSLGGTPEIGERLVTIGFPGYWHTKTLDVGYVIGTGDWKDIPIVYGSGNVYPGESGGPVLDERGWVVGVVSRISPRGMMFPDGSHIHRDVSIFVAAACVKQKLAEVL